MTELIVVVLEATDLKETELIGKQDPYVVIKTDMESHQTHTHNHGGRNPVWGEEKIVRVRNLNGTILFTIMNKNLIKDTEIGHCVFAVTELATFGGYVDKRIPVISKGVTKGYLHCQISYKNYMQSQPVQPVGPGSMYPQPGYPQPQPGYPQPVQPGYPQPQPGYPQPQPVQPGYPQPQPVQPGYPKPVQPDYPQPVQPGYPQPQPVQPGYPKPVQPDYPQPQPGYPQPQPGYPQPVQPDYSQPQPVYPQPVQPDYPQPQPGYPQPGYPQKGYPMSR